MKNWIVFLGIYTSLMAGCGGAATTSDFFLKENDTATAGVIYGENNISEAKPSQSNSAVSVALMKKEDFLTLKNHQEGYRVSDFISQEDVLSWSEQPISAFCSGVLISEDQILTAGHCFNEGVTCADVVIAFNYELESGKELSGVACKKVQHVKDSLNEQGLDYALIQLEHKVDIVPAKSAEKELKAGSAIYALGYPLGAFKKKTEGQVIELNKIYRTDLDLFSGNSGSPVFSAETHELVGIVSGGEDDFEESSQESGPARIKRCQIESCKGEFITPIQKILADMAKST